MGETKRTRRARDTPGSGRSRCLGVALGRDNPMEAYRRVVRNRGAPCIDGVTVDALWAYCRSHWPTICQRLREAAYRPARLRQALIPKACGGWRTLGIPTAVDRLTQQALVQVLTPILDPTFSGDSSGFRSGRDHEALQRARVHVAAGHRWAVDLGPAQSSDRVHHDVLMARMARWVGGKQVLRLIRRYLAAGVMAGGVAAPRGHTVGRSLVAAVVECVAQRARTARPPLCALRR